MKVNGDQGDFQEKEVQLEDQVLLDYVVSQEWLDQMDPLDL